MKADQSSRQVPISPPSSTTPSSSRARDDSPAIAEEATEFDLEASRQRVADFLQFLGELESGGQVPRKTRPES